MVVSTPQLALPNNNAKIQCALFSSGVEFHSMIQKSVPGLGKILSFRELRVYMDAIFSKRRTRTSAALFNSQSGSGCHLKAQLRLSSSPTSPLAIEISRIGSK
jgi:hypothetical protein